ncbi:putative Amino acid transporter [Giardia muris]|uniref:Putative Amino acid transporter n=1 Tax=Giardia muris TaxID=5742 RepID=A0A4Z1SWR2_GIAMU|nr:putative Amino acid transporter [Giardia muris]|eukprot:TNJ30252.1 putative Amino acid transporter [Giardia muris]
MSTSGQGKVRTDPDGPSTSATIEEKHRRESNQVTSPGTYSAGSMIGIAVNYIVGTGCLSLAKTTGNVGLILTLVIMLLSSTTILILLVYFSDVLSRAFALVRAGWGPRASQERVREAEGVNVPTASTSATPSSSVTLELFKVDADGRTRNNEAYPIPDYHISNDIVLCLSELMRIFFGSPGFYIYQITNIIFFFGTIWSYGNVVASSLTSVIPMYLLPAYKAAGSKADWSSCASPNGYADYCVHSYWIWICITLVISCLLVFFDLSKQKILQTIFTACRFLVIILVIIITFVMYFIAPFDPDHSTLNKPYANTQVGLLPQGGSIAWMYVAGQFSSLTFCQMCHHSMPEVIKPLRQTDHKKLNSSIYITYAIIFSISLLVLLLCGYYFGPCSPSLLTLNFTEWNGRAWGADAVKSPNVAATIFGYIIRLLPPIYIITAIPINAITMAGNIIILFPLSLQKNIYLTVFSKLVSIIPAMIVAGFARDLGIIIEFSGLTGFIIVSCSAIMLIRAKKVCKQVFGTTNGAKTPYSTWMSLNPIIYTTLAICGFGFVFVTAYLIYLTAIGGSIPSTQCSS